jgi:hypothetical protein
MSALAKRYGHARVVSAVVRVRRTGGYGRQGERRLAKIYMRLACGHLAERREKRIGEKDPTSAVCPTCSGET